MARNLIIQSGQIKNSDSYNDQVTNVNDSSVAEPTVSGSLEEDFNIVRTLIKQSKGTTNWFDNLGTYFDPTNTTSGDAELKNINLLNYKNNTLDSKTVIVPILNDNGGLLFSVSGTQTGILMNTSTRYATYTDRTGLPIFSSATTSGLYSDIQGSLDVCSIDIIDADTDQRITTSGGDIIYGIFYDGLDFSGTGSGTDVYVRFFAGDYPTEFPYGYETTTTVVSGVYTAPSGDSVNFDLLGGYTTPSGNDLQFSFTDEIITGGVKLIYPHRKVMSDVQEHEWFRSHFVSPFVSSATISGSTSTSSGSVTTYSGAQIIVSRRHIVLSALTDSSGHADFITGSGTSTATINCSSTPLTMAWANGYDSNGDVNYVYRETSDKYITSLTSGTTNYIYSDYNSGSPTYEITTIQPAYSYGVPTTITTDAILAHFEGSNGATSYTGVYGKSWTFAGDASISTSQYKFGTSSIRSPGSDDYLTISTSSDVWANNWTIETWVRFDVVDTGAIQTVFCSNVNFGVDVATHQNNPGKLCLFLSSNGSSWDIADGSTTSHTTTSLSDNTWYHVAIVYNGTDYRLFLDGNLEITISDSTIVNTATGLLLGCYNGGTLFELTGYLDEFRFTPYARYHDSFSKPAAAFEPDTTHYFNIPEMKMYGLYSSGWQESNVLYLGEAIVGNDGVIDSCTSYAINGRYDSDWFDVTNNDSYQKSHNIGCTDTICIDAVYRKNSAYAAQKLDLIYYSAFYGAVYGVIDRNYVKVNTAADYVSPYYSSALGSSDSNTSTTGQIKIVCDRGW